jgi:dTMP kinase
LKKGILIAFEGIDGSGITTHSKAISQKLKELGYNTIYTKEPTNEVIGNIINNILNRKFVDNKIMGLLFAADRLWHYYYGDGISKGLAELLNEGYIVITDRYKYSSFAYQGLNDETLDWIVELNKFAPDPNIIIFLDVPIDISLKRVSARGNISVFENKNFLIEVKKRFQNILKIAEKNGIKVITINEYENDNMKSIESVDKEIIDNLLLLLKNKN